MSDNAEKRFEIDMWVSAMESRCRTTQKKSFETDIYIYTVFFDR
jgi:hypothetical protein